MKALLLVVAMLASVSSFAFPRTKLQTSYTTVMLTYNTPMNQVCIDGDQMRTIEKRKYCTKYKVVRSGDDRQRVCVAHAKKYFSTPLVFEKEVCVKWRRGGRDRDPVCTKKELQTIHLPLTYTKTVTKHTWNGGRNNGDWSFPGKVISKEKFDVPYCK